MKPAEQSKKYIEELGGWRAKVAGKLRDLILKAEPGITEEIKWGLPVFSSNGLVCSVGAFKDHVGSNFFQGAALKDPKGLFNGGLEAKKTRSVNLYEGDKLDEAAYIKLVKAAVAFNAKT
jgi:hypothetical protein